VLTIAASARILRADYGAMQLDGACEAQSEIDAMLPELQLS
jgi:hypothetical protein